MLALYFPKNKMQAHLVFLCMLALWFVLCALLPELRMCPLTLSPSCAAPTETVPAAKISN